MSTLKPMLPEYLTGNQVETLHRWHLANDLKFLPADCLLDCWCHKLIAAEILGKSHTESASQRNGIFRGITTHKHCACLVLYGDLMRARERPGNGEEAKA